MKIFIGMINEGGKLKLRGESAVLITALFIKTYSESPSNTDSKAISIMSLKVNWRSSALVCS